MSEINTKTEVLKLKDISINYDGKRIPIKESERKKGQYPYYGASGIIDYIDDYLFDGEYLLIAEDGENLKSRKTPIAFIAKGKFWVNNHAHIITGNHKVLTKYLNYYFQILDISPYLTGAVMPKLTQTNLNNIEVSVPSLDKQKKIVNYLSSIDDKIELNHQINQTLEAMAQAIFKSWFIDFDPVKAKIKALKTGKDPLRAAMGAISGKTDAQLDQLPRDQYDKLAHTASLFPDKLVSSPLGDIPEGWEVGKLGNIVKVIGGYAFKSKDFCKNGDKVLKIKNINGNGEIALDNLDCVPYEITKSLGRFKLKSGELLMAMTGATIGKVGILSIFNNSSYYLNQRVAKIIAPDYPDEISLFLYVLLNREVVYSQIKNLSHGSAQENISCSGIENIDFLNPQKDLLINYCLTIKGFLRLWGLNNETRNTVKIIRDNLLHKLFK